MCIRVYNINMAIVLLKEQKINNNGDCFIRVYQSVDFGLRSRADDSNGLVFV